MELLIAFPTPTFCSVSHPKQYSAATPTPVSIARALQHLWHASSVIPCIMSENEPLTGLQAVRSNTA